MAVFKCKMCGAPLDVDNEDMITSCKYCGTKQTLPKLRDENKINLYDKANSLRQLDEFDEAKLLYQEILKDNPKDSELYWAIVLCKYGIKYVEDPRTHKRIPTVNRTQRQSIFMDSDYKLALYYADSNQAEIYKQEAKIIDSIQAQIIEISNKEDPYDVFISYKEENENGERTLDSVLAQDIYRNLTREGYKVFYSRISLEDKLGQNYEPYIYAALNSAKLMLVVSTKKEYINSVWVKNEWARYLAMIENGEDKTIIPVYREMSPNELPIELSRVQGQDMSKMGFMQELERALSKIVNTPKIDDINVSNNTFTTRKFNVVKNTKESKKEKYKKKLLVGVILIAMFLVLTINLIIFFIVREKRLDNFGKHREHSIISNNIELNNNIEIKDNIIKFKK